VHKDAPDQIDRGRFAYFPAWRVVRSRVVKRL